MIKSAPDATVFLSTATLVAGVFLTAAAAALVSNLPKRLEELTRPAYLANRDERYARLVRSTLAVLLITNTIGTLFPLSLLVIDTVEPIQSPWVWIAFSYTVYVIFINLAAVSMIYLGPVFARRYLVKSMSEDENSRAIASSPATAESINEPARHLAIRGGRWHYRTGIAIGIITGLLVGSRLRRCLSKPSLRHHDG